MTFLQRGTIPAAVVAAVAVAVLLVAGLLADRAQAATVEYPSGNASTFASGNGGWTSSADYGGLCIPSVTCPQLSGSFQSSGGAAGSGDGFIRTDSGALTLTSLLSTSTHTWRSPGFTYNGFAGKVPDNLRFSVGLNPAVAALINLGVNVQVSARAVALSGGGDQVLIDARSPGTASGWKTLSAQIGPGSLEIGKQYRIELSLSIGGLAAVLPAGSVGFDDVSLRATGSSTGNGDGNGNGNGNTPGAVLPPPKNVAPGVAYLYKNRLFIRLKCPKAFKPRCKIRAVAMTKRFRGKVVTPVRRTNLRSGRHIRKVLGVKPGFRARVRKLAKLKRHSLTLRINIRSKRGAKKATRYQRLRVIVRRR